MGLEPDPKRELLRHTLATLVYRGAKILRDAPAGFGSFRLAEGTRTPAEILAHIGDLIDWAVHLAGGQNVWRPVRPQTWDADVERFFEGARRLDAVLASDAALGFPCERLFQGPIADALTHFGQLALQRRRAGAPVRGENYFKAEIVAGRVGPEQSPARVEFE